MAWGQKTQLRALIFGAFSLLISAIAQGTASGPSSNTTGQFTASYTSVPSYHDEAQLRVSRNGSLIATYGVGPSAGSKVITVSSSGSYSIAHWSRKKGGCLQMGPNGCVEPEPGTPWSNSGGFTISVNIPTPGAITLASSNTTGGYTVSWGAASGSPSRYELQERKDGGGWSTIHSATGTSKPISGKTTGKYDYQVRACYVSCGNYTAIKTTTVVLTPGSITVPTSSTSGTIAISWASVSGAASYKLQEQKDGGSWSDVYSGTATNQTLTGRLTGTYTYRVAAIENGITGSYRTSGNVIISRAPAIPSGLTVPSSSVGAYTVSWSSVAGATSYTLEESGAASGSWTQSGTTKSLTKTADGIFIYRVRACTTYVGVSACSGWTGYKSISVNVPQIYGPVNNATGQFTISYIEGPSYATDIELRLSRDGSQIATYSIGTAAGTKSITVNGSGNYGITYWWEKEGGCLQMGPSGCTEPEPSIPWTSEGSHSIAVNIPEPSAITLASNNTSGDYSISWGAASGSPSRYELQERKDGGAWSTIHSTTTISKSVSSKTTGVYEYRVRACYGGCSDYTATKTITVIRTPDSITVPVSSTNGSVTISWSGVSGAASYKLQEQKNGGSWADVYSNTGTTATVTDRETGTYRYQVAAVENGVIGSYKISVDVIVSRAPAVPSGLTVPSSSTGGYTVKWDSVTGAENYTLEESGAGSGAWTQTGITKGFAKTNDGNYSYKVRACSVYSGVPSCSGWSATKTVNVTLPEISATASLGSPQVQVAWKAWAVDRVILKRNGAEIYNSGWSYNGQAKQITDTVSGSGGYSYSLQAWNCLQEDMEGKCTEPQMEGVRTTGVTVTLKPNTPSLSIDSANSYDGSTNLTSGGSGPIDTVRWQKRLSTGSWPVDTSYQTAAGNSFGVSGLTDGTWQFRNKNCNAAGCSDSWGNIASVTVWNQQIPSNPVIEQLSNDDDGNFTVKWTDLKAQHVYKYEIRENGALVKTLTSDSQNPNTGFSYNPPVRNDGSYNYTVKAYNLRCEREGNCPTSNAMGLIVAHRPGPPAAVTPSVLFTHTGSVSVGWNSVSGNVKRYEVVPGTAEDSDGPVTWNDSGQITHTDLEQLKQGFILDDGFHAFKVRTCNQISSYSTCSGYAESQMVQVAISEPPVAVEVPPHQETAPGNTSAEVLASDKVGVVGGEFRVSESGSASYSIPIITGPASGGAVPSISLNYSSESGNGPMGMGWKIGGLSAISACRRTFEEDGVNGSAFDRYCLDGQRLVLTSGTQGAVGSEYRTSMDSFVRVRLVSTDVGLNKGFEVYRKDGSISYYGRNEDSFEINAWYLDKQVDSAGNYIEYEYLKDTVNGEHLIQKVHYSGNGYDSTVNIIEFNYDSNRTDKIFGYAFGAKKSMTRRLTSVISKADSVELRGYIPTYETSATGRMRLDSIEECVGSTCRSATRFDYTELTAVGVNNASPSSAQLSANFMGGKAGDVNGDGLQDLVWVRYSTGDGKYYFRNTLGNASGGFDFEEDGLRARTNARREWHLIDYNDDGKDDLLHAPTDGSGWWKVNLSLGTAFSNTEITTAIPYTSDQKGNMYDFNADGLPDFLNRTSVRELERVPGGGLRFKSTSRNLTLPAPTSNKPGPLYEKTEFIKDTAVITDFNSDGVADLEAIVVITWECSENADDAPAACPSGQTVTHNLLVRYQSSGVDSYSILSSGSSLYTELDDRKSEQMFADLNGDGLPDLLTRPSSTVQWGIFHYTGTNLVFDESLPAEVGDDPVLYDWNNDGLVDVLYGADITDSFGNLHVLLNTPTGFSSPVDTGYVWGVNTNDIFHYTLDLDGDGRAEIVETCSEGRDDHNACDNYWVGMGQKYLRILKPKHVNKSIDVLTHITNGFGVTTEIQYARLNDTAAKVYTRKTGSSALNYGNSSPVFDLFSPMYVVKKVISDAPAANDDGNTVEVHYHYTGARLQGGGRGFLGFEKVTSYDPQNQVKSTTTYRQDYPYIGMPAETAKVIEPSAANISTPAACSGTGLTLISCSSNTVASIEPISGKTLVPYISKAIDKTYDIDGTYLGRVETQTLYTAANDKLYGNVSQLIVEHFDAAGTKLQNKTTTNIYSNVVDSSRWHLARLSNSTVTTERFGSPASPKITRHADFAYDPVTGLLTDEWVEKDTPLELHTHYVHDRFGNRAEATVTDADGNSRTSKTLYDGFGRYPTSELNALNQTTAQILEVDAYGQPLASLDMDGVRTTRATSQFGEAYFEHHETGSHSTSLKAMCEGCVTVAGIDSHFKVTTTGIDQIQTVVYHDRLGREIRKQTQDFHGNPVYVDTQYDEQSRVKTVSEPYGSSETPRWISYTYDKLGRTTLVNAPTGQCDVSTAYSGLTATATSCGQNKVSTKNFLGEVAEVTDNIGGKLQYSYYADGQLKNVKVLDNTGVQTALTSIEYDQVGRKTKLIDPDKGTWTYSYTGFGELQWQKDAKGQGTAMSYDKLGRMLTRADYTGFDGQTQSGTLQNFSRWYYDQDITCAPENRFDGKLLAVAQSSVEIQAGCSFNVEEIHYLKLFRHDRYGRLGETTTAIGALTESEGDFYEKVSYDKYSRAVKTWDAANQQIGQGGNYLYGAETVYNSYGYKDAIKNTETGSAYYTVEDMNVRGQVEEVSLGNGLTTTYVYDPQSHRLSDILTDIIPGIGQVQNLHYDWDTIGNLMSKTDLSGDSVYSKDLQESYEYDGLNRLRYARLYLAGSLTSTQEVSYYDNGNIKTKTGVGTYTYGSSRPHAVTSTQVSGGPSIAYIYDLNGNLVSDGNSRNLSYAVFDKPTEISKGSHSTSFWYDPDRNRYKRVDDNGSGIVTTLQIGSVEKVTERGSGGAFIKAYYRRSIAGVVVEKMDLDQSDNITARNIQYLLKDLQGSLDVITTATGQVAEENGQKQVFNFDAWGKRRSPFDWAQLTTPENIVSTLKVGTFNHLRTNRGYTGHEMLDETGLIHMNGRVYDPTLARFVSADPTIDGVTSTQGFNRYAYVHNNPLAYSDPSGYSRWNFYRDRLLNNREVHRYMADKPLLNAVAQIAICVASNVGCPFALAAYNANQTYQVTGDIGLALFNGILAGASAAAFSGMPGGWGAEAIVARGFVGGVLSMMGGGKFGHGFVSAGVGGGFSKDTGLATRMIVSGVVSAATGGKFANGAMTAAFAYVLQSASPRVSSNNRAHRANSHTINGSSPHGRDSFSSEKIAEIEAKLDALRADLVGTNGGDFKGTAAKLNNNKDLLNISWEYDIEISATISKGGTIRNLGTDFHHSNASTNVASFGSGNHTWHTHPGPTHLERPIIGGLVDQRGPSGITGDWGHAQAAGGWIFTTSADGSMIGLEGATGMEYLYGNGSWEYYRKQTLPGAQ